MDIKTIRLQLEEFDLELSKEHLQHLVGLKEELNSAPIYDKYPGLFSLDNIKTVQKAYQNADNLGSRLEKRRHLYLLGAVVGSFMSEPLKELSDERDTYEAKAVVQAGRDQVPLRQMGIIISNEPSHKKRKDLFELCLKHKKKLQQYDKKILQKEWGLAKSAGFKDYTSLFSFVKECDYDQMAAQMQRFLAETNPLYLSLIKKEMKKIGVDLSEAESFDISFWMRNPCFDKYFSKENLVPSLKETLAGLGIAFERQNNIKLDVEERPAKVSRAFCMPLQIPEEVHLVIKPSGGQTDYKSLYHECGHSEHYANSLAKLPFEFKHLGSHCVSETYAFAFEHIIMSNEWLKHHTSMDATTRREFLGFDMTVKLFFLRRYAAKLIYELKLHRRDLTRLDDSFLPLKGKKYKTMAECYSCILSKAVKVRVHPVSWASDVDGGYYSADYLRAWILEAQLREHLKKEYGSDWMHNPKSGEFLKSLWRDANKPTPTELANKFGFKEINMDVMLKEVKGFFEGN